METIRKTSRKRQAMLSLLRASREHPNAEMLYAQMKDSYPELSLGTVYRNLSVLAEEGSVVALGKVDGHERYDARTEPHPHFICRRCHRVLDLDLPDMISDMFDTIDKSFDCRSESYSLSISGLCAPCRDAEEAGH